MKVFDAGAATNGVDDYVMAVTQLSQDNNAYCNLVQWNWMKRLQERDVLNTTYVASMS